MADKKKPGKSRGVFMRDRKLGLPQLPAFTLRLPKVTIGIPTIRSFQLASRNTRRLIMAASGIGTGVVGIAIAFAVFSTDVAPPMWPEPGAAYSLPNTQGIPLDPYENATTLEEALDGNQTLQINLAAGTRLTDLSIGNADGIQLGKSGLEKCFVVERAAGNTTAYINTGSVTVTNPKAPTMNLANSQIGVLTASGAADGHLMSATINSSTTAVYTPSSRGAGSYVATGIVDRVIVTLYGDVYITNGLSLSNLYCSAGTIDLQYIKTASLNLSNVLIGSGSGIDSADLTIATTTIAGAVNSTLQDKFIAIR